MGDIIQIKVSKYVPFSFPNFAKNISKKENHWLYIFKVGPFILSSNLVPVPVSQKLLARIYNINSFFLHRGPESSNKTPISMRNPNPYSFRNINAIQYNDEVEEDNDSDDNEENLDTSFAQNGNYLNYDDSKRHPKKRKLDSFVSSYDSAPRRENWSDEESFALLEVWGERYVELGRRSLRGEDWVEVSEKLVDRCGRERTEGECRNQLDVLKNRYKKERAKVESGVESKWVFFKKIDALLSSRTRGFSGLGCGLDSGEYVFMNPRVYLDRSNVLDEMRDSPAESDEDDGDDDEEDLGGEDGDNEENARLLADSIHKFGAIYEKIEESKRKQMVELETMRQDFMREMELQKKQIVDRAEAEIAKLREMDEDDDDDDEVDGDENNDEDTDTSVENFGD